MLGQLDPYLVGAVLLVVLALDGSLLIGAVLPGDAAIVVAGTALTGPAEIVVAAVAGVAGCYLGATGGWLIGRRYGSRVRHSRAGRWIGEHRWARAERLATGEGGGPALAAAYFLPVVNSLTPILAGTLGMPYRRFIRWALAGGTVWVSTYLVLGSLAGDFVRHNEHLTVPIAGCLAILAAGLMVIGRRVRAARAVAVSQVSQGSEVSEPGGSPAPRTASPPPR
ncbi:MULTISPECIES: DedA family protein [Streptosporangium]|uniref:Membrane-associated protein n=1 Tax=Streptosporangium brasiliense TaxID=47480 RepID=A0ABT9RBL5_9ACTN|nr:VTT domain-containing protein [Streptosporangium brasiliense]MDP9866658.1 membrane-associated protein [Streptosporangium brasiliense]